MKLKENNYKDDSQKGINRLEIEKLKSLCGVWE
jgi:hypothetical protein